MTPRHWITVGWGFMAGAALLAVIAVVQVFVSIDDDVMAPQAVHDTAFLRGVVAAVLAGVAFFAGLASFFWSATRRRDDLLEQILRSLPN